MLNFFDSPCVVGNICTIWETSNLKFQNCPDTKIFIRTGQFLNMPQNVLACSLIVTVHKLQLT